MDLIGLMRLKITKNWKSVRMLCVGVNVETVRFGRFCAAFDEMTQQEMKEIRELTTMDAAVMLMRMAQLGECIMRKCEEGCCTDVDENAAKKGQC